MGSNALCQIKAREGVFHTATWGYASKEVVGDRMYTHIHIHPGTWSNATLKAIREDLRFMCDCVFERPFYALLSPDAHKEQKLVRLLGYSHAGYEADADGEICLTYIRRNAPYGKQ